MNPGKELDALVAEKVMGIPIQRGYSQRLYLKSMIGNYPQSGFTTGPVPGIQILDKCPDDEDHFKIGGPFQLKSFDPWPESYSTSIEAAWRVVEKINLETITRYEGRWICTNVGSDFWHEAELQNRYENLNDGTYIEISDTAPHAICLAALEAVGVEV